MLFFLFCVQTLTKESVKYMTEALKDQLKKTKELDSNSTRRLYDTEPDSEAESTVDYQHSPEEVSTINST